MAAIDDRDREEERVRRVKLAERTGAEQLARNRKGFTEAELDAGARRVRQQKMTVPEVLHDVDLSMARGAARGVAGAPGAPFDIMRLGQIARAYVDSTRLGPKEYAGRSGPEVLTTQDAEREAGVRRGPLGHVLKPSMLARQGGEGWIKSAEALAPEMRREPESPTGETLGHITETATGGAMGNPAAVLGRSLSRGAVREGLTGAIRGHGLGRDIAGGAAAGAAQEGVEAVGGGSGWQTAAALAAGPLAATYGSRTPADLIRGGVGRQGVTPDQIRQAEGLYQRAQREGLRLTRANALDWVTGSNAQGISELQRVVESTGNPRLAEFFTENAPPGPTRVRAAGERMLNTIGPESTQPSTIGPRVAGVMGEHIAQTERNVNEAVRPQYQSFQAQQVPAPEMQQLLADPAFMRAYQQVLTQPDYASLIRGLPPDSVGVVDLARRAMETRRTNLTTPGGSPEGMDATAAGGLARPIAQAEGVASQASVPPPGQPAALSVRGPQQPGRTPLEQVQQDRAVLQETTIDPLAQGPEGKMARAETTEGVEGAAFPAQPREGSHHEIGRAVSTLAQQDPNLARELVRNYLGSRFSVDTGRNVGGEPYTAGTKFWKDVAGSSQPEQNLQAAIEALPGGQATWAGVREMGDIFEAMGKRQAPGSKTAPNIETIENLKGRGWSDKVIKLVTSVGTAIPGMSKEATERWRLGANGDEIARLITDPAAAREFADILATTAPGSVERVHRFGRILSIAGTQQAAEPLVRDPLLQPPEAGP
jgi:hypothetical protein